MDGLGSSISNRGKNWPALSICIPTYKRPELLRKCLSSISIAIGDLHVPVRVYDDSCTSINAEVYEEALEFMNLEVHLNEDNLGIDENIARCIEDAQSTYVLVLGEDDSILEDAVEEIIRNLESFNYGFFFLNYSYVSNDGLTITRERRVPIYSDMTLSGKEFFEEYLWASGFIGSCVINKNSWNKVDRRAYRGTFFTHVGVISEIIRESDVRMIARPLVLNRAEDASSASWAQKAFEVNVGWSDMLRAAARNYGSESLIRAESTSKAVFWHESLLFLVSKRADGLYKWSTWKTYVWHRERAVAFKAIALLPLIIPPILLKTMKAVRKVFI